MSEEEKKPSKRNDNVSKEERYNWKVVADDTRGKYREIPKGELAIDPAYQREEQSSSRIAYIRENFCWAAFGCLLVVERAGVKYFIYDGGHRHAATLDRDSINLLPCLVFTCESVAEEARLFIEANLKRGAMSSWHKYRGWLKAAESPAALAADPNIKRALAVEKMVRSSGYRITLHKDGRHSVTCIATLMSEQKLDADVAHVAWDVCVRLNEADDKSKPINNVIYSALCYFERYLRRNWLNKLSIDRDPVLGALLFLENEGILREIQRFVSDKGRGGPKIAAEGLRRKLSKKDPFKRKYKLASILDEDPERETLK